MNNQNNNQTPRFRLNETLDGELKRRCITELNTQIGYLRVLEYELQDCSWLHVVQWNFHNDWGKDNSPKVNYVTFYKEKDKALTFAHEIANHLLQQYE